jgi:hypothetical protein
MYKHQKELEDCSIKKYSHEPHRYLLGIYLEDLITAFEKDQEYGSAWKKRGGTGAFHQGIARKWDRIENMAARHNYDIFAAIRNSKDTAEALIDTIRDLRVYLALIENEMMMEGVIPTADVYYAQKIKDKPYTIENLSSYNSTNEDLPSYNDPKLTPVKLPDLPPIEPAPVKKGYLRNQTEHPKPFGYDSEDNGKHY